LPYTSHDSTVFVHPSKNWDAFCLVIGSVVGETIALAACATCSSIEDDAAVVGDVVDCDMPSMPNKRNIKKRTRTYEYL
jgi:hypothetical protein